MPTPEVVLDASVVLGWFAAGKEEPSDVATFQQYRRGGFRVAVPGLLYLEIVNVAARRWRWPVEGVRALFATVGAAGFLRAEPPWPAVIDRTASGLTAYDASYLALAEHRGTRLVTRDREILRAAPSIATTPSAFAESL